MHTGLILSAGVLALLSRTEKRVATAQQLIVAAVITLAVWYGSVVIPHFGESAPGFDQVVFGTLILIFIGGVVPALHPRRGELLSIEGRINRPMAAFAIIGFVVAAPYALDQIQIQLTADLATDPHSGEQFHWNEMATTALTLPAIALVAAFGNHGWRLVAWTAGLGTMIFGTASILLPLQASSPGVAWGAMALIGGMLFILIAEIEIRRGPD